MSDELTSETSAEATAPAAPLLQVLNAHATDEEIAAIVAVFASLQSAAPAPRPKRSEWNHPRRGLRTSLPGSWRASTLA